MISIHALLAESDIALISIEVAGAEFLSTLSLRRATKRQPLVDTFPTISIHALLAESDQNQQCVYLHQENFYPRSPCGERQSGNPSWIPFQQFLSTLSLRRATFLAGCLFNGLAKFLSTLSLRRATDLYRNIARQGLISIHALLAESDIVSLLPRAGSRISIHALLAESDCVFDCIDKHTR